MSPPPVIFGSIYSVPRLRQVRHADQSTHWARYIAECQLRRQCISTFVQLRAFFVSYRQVCTVNIKNALLNKTEHPVLSIVLHITLRLVLHFHISGFLLTTFLINHNANQINKKNTWKNPSFKNHIFNNWQGTTRDFFCKQWLTSYLASKCLMDDRWNLSIHGFFNFFDTPRKKFLRANNNSRFFGFI